MKKRFFLYCLVLICAAVVSGCGCGGNEGSALVSIEVSPADPSIPIGDSQQFTATGVFSDNTTLDITETVTWSSSDTGTATISNTEGSKGLATSGAVGSTAITATSGSISGKTTLTVIARLASIEVTPANPTVTKGMTLQFKATGIFTDNSTQDLTATATWSSSDTTIASVSNDAGSQGVASALSAGTITVTAASGGLSGSTSMTVKEVTLVSIKVTPENIIARFGISLQYTATGTYSDGSTADITTLVTWTSSDTSIATISNAAGSQGLATTDHKIGRTTIRATLGAVSGSTLLIDP